MLDVKSWKEFRDAGMLWWVNRTLQLFGWSIKYEFDGDMNVTGVMPVRTRHRGFTKELEAKGHQQLTAFIADNIETLADEANS